jgi:signal transduction histidine kinase
MTNPPPKLAEIEAALRLFDETTAALSSRIQRLEEVVVQKQQELVATNQKLNDNIAQLDRTTAWLNLVMESVASGVIAVDRDAIVTTCNRMAENLLSAVLPDPVGADWRAAFPDSPLLDVLAGKIIGPYERTIITRDKRRCTLAVKAAPLHGTDGQLIGAVEIFEDVTEMRLLQESVERADRLKQLGEMAAGVAHEIRNPLNGIEGFASLLVRDLPSDDKRHKFASHIVDGVRTLNHTVSALLAFTNPRRIERKKITPRSLVESCIELVKASEIVVAHTPAISFHLADRTNGDAFALDAIHIKQVVLNILQNAVQALADHGTTAPQIHITIERQHDELIFIIDDNGPGVPLAERQRIFTPFYTTKDTGTGLGLAICYTIANLHGGSLAVSDAPSGGARFILRVR